MAPLAIYKEVKAGIFEEILDYDEAVSGYLPVITTHNGVDGDVVEGRLFVRASKTSEYYTDIAIVPESVTGADLTTVSAGDWGIKLSSAKIQPTEIEWSIIDYGTSVSLADIGSSLAGDINTYLPFWYRLECPANAPGGPKTGIVFTLSCTANAVGI